MTPLGHPKLHQQYQSLAGSYADEYRRTRNIEDLEIASKLKHTALSATAEGHPERPGQYHALAISYIYKYREPKDLQNVEAALKYGLAAVTATLEGHPALASRYHTLAISYTDMYRVAQIMEDLEAALKYNLEAVAATPLGHPALPQWQTDLAMSYLDRYELYGDVQHLNKAQELYISAMQSQTAAPQNIWTNAESFTQGDQFFDPHHILKGFSLALNILPSLLWLGNSIEIRHDTLLRNDVAKFIATAVTTAVQDSQIQLAVEYFEQGLSTTHQQNLELKLHHTNVELELPEISKELENMSASLQGALHTPYPSVNYHLLAHNRQWLISQICTHPSFEEFLLPPRYPALAKASQFGPVIMLNHTGAQTDAIIILSLSTHPIHLKLNNVSPSAVEEYVSTLKDALHTFSIHSREMRFGRMHKFNNFSSDNMLGSVINWLWEAVVKPIFDVLEMVRLTTVLGFLPS
jgi:hypothetical protein